jgi:hypothetical protein
MAVIVGDIHGNLDKATAFLAYKPEEEHVALGDYVDSFTEPVFRQIDCLQLLLDSNAVLLWGNHDLHYLAKPPFICTGYQHKFEQPYRELIEANKHRFLAAYAVDGWLCTHAGVAERLSKGVNDVETLAAYFNDKMAEYIDRPFEPGAQGIFGIGKGRGGEAINGGIFWFDFRRESGIDLGIKQIFGHTETPEPVINDHYVPQSYVALDTTNNKEHIYLYDTSLNQLVCLPMKAPKRPGDSPSGERVDKYKIDIVFKDHNKSTYLYLNYDSEKHREMIKLLQEIIKIADDEPRTEGIRDEAPAH